MLQMEVFIDVERGVLLNAESEVASVRFGVEFERMVFNEFVVDLHLNDCGFFLVYGKYN